MAENNTIIKLQDVPNTSNANLRGSPSQRQKGGSENMQL